MLSDLCKFMEDICVSLLFSKVVAEKGQKRLMARCSDSKETVTVLACINADGVSMAPMLICKGKTKASVQSFETYLAPPDTFWTYQSKGWMEHSLGVEWFRHIFLPGCGTIRPQLLHEVLELLELAKEESIHIFALPPHTTQLLQPLDTNVFKPFKSAYNKSCGDFLYDNPSRVIDKKSFPLMFAKAWETMKDRNLVKNAFASTGIYPPNRNAISNQNYLPATALDRPLPVNMVPTSLPITTPSEVSVTPVISFESASSEMPSTSTSIPQFEPFSLEVEMPYSPLQFEMQPSPTFDPFLVPSTPIQSEMPSMTTSTDLLAQACEMSGLSALDGAQSLPKANWNSTVDDIFGIPATEPRQSTQNRQTISSHRLLTSSQIIEEKREKDRLKQLAEEEKLRKQKAREEKNKSAPGKGPQSKSCRRKLNNN